MRDGFCPYGGCGELIRYENATCKQVSEKIAEDLGLSIQNHDNWAIAVFNEDDCEYYSDYEDFLSDERLMDTLKQDAIDNGTDWSAEIQYIEKLKEQYNG